MAMVSMTPPGDHPVWAWTARIGIIVAIAATLATGTWQTIKGGVWLVQTFDEVMAGIHTLGAKIDDQQKVLATHWVKINETDKTVGDLTVKADDAAKAAKEAAQAAKDLAVQMSTFEENVTGKPPKGHPDHDGHR